MKKLLSFLRIFFRVGIVQALPAGMTFDKSTLFGLFAFQANSNAQGESTLTVAGVAAATLTLTAAQGLCGALKITQGAANQGCALTLPSTAALFSLLGPSIPVDGTFSKYISINNQTNQTLTLTAGDASTTVSGTATLATNTVRTFCMTVTSATTITFDNFGSAAV